MWVLAAGSFFTFPRGRSDVPWRFVMHDFFLADDLSGALDAAAAFHHAGRRVTVALTPDAWSRAAAGAVVGFTTETRNAPPDQAAAAVARAIAQGRAGGGRLVYKKIDSTLRGPVAAELTALAAALPEARLLFAPANPRAGRTVRQGILRVHGVPVAETDFARDPVSPVRESSIPRLLGGALAARLTIADAETEEDLARAVAGMNRSPGPWVAVGSGALARPVAACMTHMDTHCSAGTVSGPRIAAGAVLVVCGSAHPANQAQAARAQQERGLAVCGLQVADPAAGIRATIAALRENAAVALHLEARRADSAAALQAIATAAARVIRAAAVRRVFVTGGETAGALCHQLGISSLEFRDEIEPGLGLSRAEMPDGAILLAVKPGGFGDARTWMRACDGLRRQT